MKEFLTQLLYRPLFNALIFLYNVIPGHDFGVAIIVLTALIRLVFLPLTIKTVRSQKALNEINPKIKEIKDKHKSDTTAQSAEIMKLYKENNINPLAGCLPLIIQLPILFTLYRVFINGLKTDSLNLLYPFITNPKVIAQMSLGFINITARNPALAVLSGVAQFFQLKISAANSGGGSKDMQAMNRQMLYFFPVLIIIIGWNLPAALMFYWIATTVIAVGEQMFIKYKYR